MSCTTVPYTQAKICKGCWGQLKLPVPLRGPASIPFRVFGIRPSRMNPNTCTICEVMFERVMKARQIVVDATVLFVDLRGYTTHARSHSDAVVSGLLGDFYDVCADAIWEHDGLLNKTIGDAIMAIFNFPIRDANHAERAILAARQIQLQWQARREALRDEAGRETDELGIGIGIDSGKTSFGEFGQSHRDLTAIGAVVNTAARAQAAARGGEILVTKAVFERARDQLPESEGREYRLKGFDRPLMLYSA